MAIYYYGPILDFQFSTVKSALLSLTILWVELILKRERTEQEMLEGWKNDPSPSGLKLGMLFPTDTIGLLPVQG